jgi:hypothetical protein
MDFDAYADSMKKQGFDQMVERGARMEAAHYGGWVR